MGLVVHDKNESRKESARDKITSVHGGDIYRSQVKLDFSVNINPLGMPEKVRRALTEAVEWGECYPDICWEELTAAIGEACQMPKELILCGNGASELFLAAVHGLTPEKVLIPIPSFFGYEWAAGAGTAKICYYEMKEEDDFLLTEDFLKEIVPEVGLIFLANPNNPTGRLIDSVLLKKICDRCQQTGTILLLDECFLEFTGEAGFFQKYSPHDYPNVLVVRAFTKIFAMPGVRLGYLFSGSVKLAERIRRQLPEWNLSCFAEKAGLAALQEKDYIDRAKQLIQKEKAYLSSALENMGFVVWHSDTDFLLFKGKEDLYEKLLARGILIRDCGNFKGLQKGYYRIAVKKHEDNQRLVEAIKTCMGEATWNRLNM